MNMTQEDLYQDHEKLIMLAVQPLIKELLLVDVADLIAYLTFDQHNLITDIVDSALEQYFAPGHSDQYPYIDLAGPL